jgi:hypothetical protein
LKQAPQANGKRHEEHTCNSKENVPPHSVDFRVLSRRSAACPVVESGQIQKPQKRQQKKEGSEPQRQSALFGGHTTKRVANSGSRLGQLLQNPDYTQNPPVPAIER